MKLLILLICLLGDPPPGVVSDSHLVAVGKRWPKRKNRGIAHGGHKLRRAMRLKEELLVKQNYRCGICGEQFIDRREATFDHIVPFSLGGTDAAFNLRLAHPSCNSERNAKLW